MKNSKVIKEEKSDWVRILYLRLQKEGNALYTKSVPFIRRIIRFIALPYCYFQLVNWNECTASRYQVFKDFLYIFFQLKYFPDNYSLCRLWEKDRSTWKFYYGSIYDPYQRGRLRLEVQKKEYGILFDDKYVCYQLCIAAGLPVPEQYAFINPTDDFKSIILSILENNPTKNIIIKPNKGKGGDGIFLVYHDGYRVMCRSLSNVIPLDEFKLNSPSVVQEYITQHESLEKISPSVNTVRIVTLYTKNDRVITIGAEMRFGVNDAYLDNTSSGGVAIGINVEKGILKKTAYDFSSRMHFHHPTSGFIFEGFKIPLWNEVVDLAHRIQLHFSYYKLLGHDIAITADGPIILEINSDHDNVGLEQAFGPILANPEVLSEFKAYNLLINKMN